MQTELQEYLEKHPHSNKNQFMVRLGFYAASKQIANDKELELAIEKELQGAGLTPTSEEITEIREEIIDSIYSESEHRFV